MASRDSCIRMDRKTLERLWFEDITGFTKENYIHTQEHMVEESCEGTKSDENQTKTEGDKDIVEKDPDENGYFSVFLDEEELEGSENSENGESSDEEVEREKPAESEDKPGEKLLPFSEMKRLAGRWMKPLLLNIDGMNEWNNDKGEEALKLFHQAAEVDVANVNALKHSRYVLRKMNRQTEANEVDRKIRDLLASEDGRLIQARSEAELGMVIKALQWMEDLGTVTGHLVNAIKLAGDDIHPAEVEFWRLNLAESFHWWYLCRWQSGIPGALECLEKSIELFCEVAVSMNADNLTQAQALYQLGNLCNRRREVHVHPILEKAIKNAYIFRGSTYAQDYLDKAYSLDPDSPIICVEYGTFLMRNRKLKEAKKIFDQAFEILDPETKYFNAFAMRGELYTKLYNQDKQKQYLEHAIEDLRYFTKHVHQSYGFGMLGTANYLLIMHDDPIYIEKEDMAPALQAYEAAIHLLGYRRNTLSHFHHAECLADFGYLRRAVESSKRAIEHDLAGKNPLHIILDFMKQLLQLYEDRRKPDYIMSECVFWMNLICHKYETYLLRKLLRDLYEIHRSAICRLYHNLLFNGHEHSARLFPDFIPDFRPWCPHPPKGYIPPPKPSYPYNIHNKPFDFLLLHSDFDTPGVYASFLTKFEQLYKLKGCVIGRDIEGDSINEDVLAKLVSTMIPVRTTETAELATKKTGNGKSTEADPNGAAVKHTQPERVSQDETASTTAKKPHDSSTQNTDQAKGAEMQGNEPKQKEAGQVMKKKHPQTPLLSGAYCKPVYVHERMRSIGNTPALSACLIILVTPAFVHSAWFQEDGNDRRPHPKLQELLDAHHHVLVLKWDKEPSCAKLFPGCTNIKVFDCSDLVHWDKIVYWVQLCAGRVIERLLSKDLMIPITDQFLA